MEGDRIPVPKDCSEAELRAYAERVGYPFEKLWEDVHADAGVDVLSVVAAFGLNELWASLGMRENVHEVVVGARFRLIRRVGAGSYGTVYEAEDVELGRKVAVKVMPIEDPDVADREGKALAAVNHPNIVKIFDHGRADDYRWLVLEFLDGPTLDRWCEGKGTREILSRYRDAGEGLAAAHRQGLIHRDFKPGNVMITAEGHAVVTDFGLARNLESLNDRAPEESTLMGSGTLGFLSRERLQGAPGDERSDQFAFCVSLWWALTGSHPFDVDGELRDYFDAMGGPPRGGRTLPRRLRRVLERGLAPLPGDRWPSMARLLEELGDATSRRRAWWLGAVLLLLGSGTLISWNARVLFAPAPLRIETSLVDEMSLEALEAIEEDDHAAIVQALSMGYPAAMREGRAHDFIRVSWLAATTLQDAGNDFDAEFAWAMTGRLARQAQLSELEDYAWRQVRKLSPHL